MSIQLFVNNSALEKNPEKNKKKINKILQRSQRRAPPRHRDLRPLRRPQQVPSVPRQTVPTIDSITKIYEKKSDLRTNVKRVIYV